MVTFNFSNVSGNPFGQRVSTPIITTVTTATPSGMVTITPISFTTIVTFGNNPIEFTSNLTGAGLPGDTMKFTVTASSDFYSMNFIDSLNRLDLEISGGFLGSPATFTMTFDGGSGLTRLSDVAINGGGMINEFVLLLTESGSTPYLFGTFSGEITGIKFLVAGGLSITSITGTPTCFAEGTAIAVPGGETPVEALQLGDMVITHDGGTRKVLWVGRQSFDLSAGLPDELQLVRIKAGAFGRDAPARDLVVTADHALLLDDTLYNAGALVNGDTISLEPASALARRVTVYHVETEDHAVILAEGVPAETFVDARQRSQFDNYDEYLELYGADRIIPAMPVPRASSARLVERSADRVA